MSDKPKSRKKRDANRNAPAVKTEEDKASLNTRDFMRPTLQAALTLLFYGKDFGDLCVLGLMDSLTEQSKAVNNGDLSRAETMLAVQAHTLDAIFNNLARLAAVNKTENMHAGETFLKLALRAQSQCRATLETLAEIKHPRSIAFVGQANIAHGHQQINNTPSCADETKNTQNKLLEQNDGQRLDTGTTSAAVGTDKGLETVGAVKRAKNS